MKEDKKFPFYRFMYNFGRKLICPLVLKKYTYKTDICPQLSEPCIIMSNHLTERDMFMVGSAFPEHMYFVCGEHLMRSALGPVLKFLQDPIPAPRGGNMSGAALNIMRRIRRGHNVMMFPEGCRSFNGETLPVGSANAELVKRMHCGLVTYKISGGYFTAPRWSYKPRTGPVWGKVVNVYSSDEIKDMSVGELLGHINSDLYENAYETQKKHHFVYKYSKRAEGLENYLLLCPDCHGFDTMTSCGNSFRCARCGLGGEYNEYGMLKGEGLPYDSVYDWGKWIEKEFDTYVASHTDPEPVFTDENVSLYDLSAGLKTKFVERGKLYIYKDRLEFCGRTFPFEDIKAKSLLYFGKSWLFTCKYTYLKLTGPSYHAWKTDRIYDIFNKKRASL